MTRHAEQYEQLPTEIEKAVALQFLVWSECGHPRMAVIPRGYKRLWQFVDRMTVADHEQVAEYHTRLARRAIRRYKTRRSYRSVETAADHIVRSRFHRSAALLLMGVTPTESMLPFSRHGMEDDAE